MIQNDTKSDEFVARIEAEIEAEWQEALSLARAEYEARVYDAQTTWAD